MAVQSHDERYGHKRATWEQAKNEAIRALVARARSGGDPTISYSELTTHIPSIPFNPEDYGFHALLYEISEEEDAAGRGLLSVLVVHKDGDGRPGRGFWDMAKKLGRDTRDKERFWAEEVTLVLTHSRNHPLAA